MAQKLTETQTKTSIKAMNDKQSHYHMSNSDRPCNLLVFHPLNGTNYSTLKRFVVNALRSKHKLVFMDRKLPKSKEDLDEDDWLTCNAMVVACLLNSLNEELPNNIAYHDTIYDIWRDLKKSFS